MTFSAESAVPVPASSVELLRLENILGFLFPLLVGAHSRFNLWNPNGKPDPEVSTPGRDSPP